MKLFFILFSVALVTGCATLRHQVSEEKPHAVLIIQYRDSYEHMAFRSVRIDGRKVLYPPWTERHYRVTPGDHTITVEIERQETKTNPNYGLQKIVWALGSLAAMPSGQLIYGDGPSKSYTVTSYSYITNAFTVEAGRTYVLEGPTFVSKTGTNP